KPSIWAGQAGSAVGRLANAHADTVNAANAARISKLDQCFSGGGVRFAPGIRGGKRNCRGGVPRPEGGDCRCLATGRGSELPDQVELQPVEGGGISRILEVHPADLVGPVGCEPCAKVVAHADAELIGEAVE